MIAENFTEHELRNYTIIKKVHAHTHTLTQNNDCIKMGIYVEAENQSEIGYLFRSKIYLRTDIN